MPFGVGHSDQKRIVCHADEIEIVAAGLIGGIRGTSNIEAGYQGRGCVEALLHIARQLQLKFLLLLFSEFGNVLRDGDEGCSVRKVGPHLPVEFGVVQARLQDSWSLAQGFVATVSRGRLKGWIHVLNYALRIGEHHAVGSLLDDPGKQYETLQSLPSLGEIVKHDHASRDQARRVFQGPRIYADPLSGSSMRVAQVNQLIENFLPANGAYQGQLIRRHDRDLIGKIPALQRSTGVG